MLENSLFAAGSPVARIVLPIAAAVAIGGGGIVYAVHEHNAAQKLAQEKAQMSAQLSTTHSEIDALTARVNAMAANQEAETKPAAAQPAPVMTTARRAANRRSAAQDARFNKLQTQLDAQGKQIDAQGQEIADARNDLTNTRTELTGSIARTHGELVVLEKRGERNYYEFDITKSKEFKREGPVGISLRKANEKRSYADLMLMVDDRNLQTKHVNLFQPSMFYENDRPQPIEIVINDISKNHIHGYVSAPKYRKSELEAMATANANAGTQQASNSDQGDNGIVGQAAANGSDQTANQDGQPTLQKRPPQASGDADQP